MLQTMIVIKLTGLLLLTPDTRAGALPMHVLMPDRGIHVPMTHTPEVGFLTSAGNCNPRPGSTTPPAAFAYDSVEGVCYVNMDGWSMEIGTRSSNPTTVSLPIGTNNLSTALQKYVDRSLLGDTPDARIRGRVTLNEGVPIDSCNRYSFHVQRRGSDGALKDTILRLTNVLDWKIENFQEPTLALVRRRLNPQPGQKLDTVAVVAPVGNVITVLVRQLSDHDRQHLPQGPLVLGDPVTHFLAYFDVLGVPFSDQRPPRLQSTQPNETCSWPYVPRFAPSRRRMALVAPMAHAGRHGQNVRIDAAGTAACMVASALPSSP